MTWKQEIFRALLLAFGMAEIICNITYLTKHNGISLARKQHGELPRNATDINMKVKVVCMLLSGIMFFVVALSSYLFHQYSDIAVRIVFSIYAVYGIIEASYYKHWKTTGFALVGLALLAVYIFI